MSMTPRQRVRAVFQGQTPDQVPLLLDLSHWYKKNHNVFFDLRGFQQVDHALVELHQSAAAVAYVEMGAFYRLELTDDTVTVAAWTDDQGVYHHRITTPLGALEEERVFEPTSYSYNIRKHLLASVADFDIVCYLMERYRAVPCWQRCADWCAALGELAFPYVQLPYSGFGYLISRNFGVEKTCLATFDAPDAVRRLVDAVNACNLRILETIIDGPFEVLIISDNFDSNVQNPRFFAEYTRDYYAEVARRLHAKGKYLAIHVDGEMRGCLAGMAAAGVDCIDACTPAPMFALTPAQARAEAGTDLILSGGIPATIFGSQGTDEQFVAAVRAWLDTRRQSPRLMLAAGDQVPPDAPWRRIAMLPELVARYGRY